MPLNFKHINANEQILDGSIGTSLLADGSVTAAKLAFGAITSSNLLVDSNIDFNNFQALQFRVENLNFFPVPGNPGRIIWRTDLLDLFVDADFTLNIVSAKYLPLQIKTILDGIHMTVNDTTGIAVNDAIIQGGAPFAQVDILAITDATHIIVSSTVGISTGFVLTQNTATTTVTSVIDATHLAVVNSNGFTVDVAAVSAPFGLAIVAAVTDATHLTVNSTVGFTGQAIVQVDFGIVTVTDGIHLVVDNSSAMSVGDVITQGLATTTITAVTDLTHIIVVDTTGFSIGITIVHAPIDILAVPDSTHLTVSNAVGFGPGDVITQGLATTTIVTVVDATHLTVVNTSGFIVNTAADSTVVVGSTTNVKDGTYLTQGAISSLILDVINSTNLAVVDATGLIPGTAFIGNWISINEGANVTSVYSDNNPHLHGDIQFLSGTNVHLPQVSQTITVNVPAAGITGQIQFNNDGLNDFGADPNLFWDNINKRLGLGNSVPTKTLDVTGDGHFSSDVTVDTAIHTPLVTGTSPLTLRPGSGSSVIQMQDPAGAVNILLLDTSNSSLHLTENGGGYTEISLNNSTAGGGKYILFNDTGDTTEHARIAVDNSGTLNLASDSLSTGKVLVNVGTVNAWEHTWTFDNVGTLTTAGDVIVPSANIIIKSAPSLANGLHFWGEVNEDENGQIDFYTHDGSQFLGEIAGWLRANSPFNGNPLSVIELNAFDSFTGATNTIQSRLTFITRDAAGNAHTWGVNEVGTFSNLPDFIATSLSAVLQLDSTTQGFLPPRMTTAQRNGIASPAIGLLIYNTDSSLYNFWTGIAWLPVGSPVGNVGDVQFNAGGGLFGADPNFYWDISNARLGIGNAAPALTLDVSGPVAIRNVSNTPGHGDLTFYNDAPVETTIETRSSDGSTVFGNLFLGSGGFELQSALGTGSISVNTFGLIQTWNFNLDGSFNSPVSASVGYGNGVFAPAATLDVNGTGHFATNLTVDGTGSFKNATVLIGTALTHEGGIGIHIDANPSGSNAATIEMLGASSNNNFSAIGFVTGDNSTQVGLIYAENAGGTQRVHIQAAGESQPGEVRIANGQGQEWIYDTNGALGFPALGNGTNLTVTGSDGLNYRNPGTSAYFQLFSDNSEIIYFYNEAASVENFHIGFNHDFGAQSEIVSRTAQLNLQVNGNTWVYDTVAALTNPGSVYVPAGQVGVGTSSPAASASIDIQSTTRGFLPPRMTTGQRNAIATPATGLIIYNTDANTIQEYNGTMWRNVSPLFQQDVFNVLGPGNIFTLTFTPLANSQHVFYNGLSLAPGVTEDYTISGNVVTLNGSIVLTNGDKILITYSY